MVHNGELEAALFSSRSQYSIAKHAVDCDDLIMSQQQGLIRALSNERGLLMENINTLNCKHLTEKSHLNYRLFLACQQIVGGGGSLNTTNVFPELAEYAALC